MVTNIGTNGTFNFFTGTNNMPGVNTPYITMTVPTYLQTPPSGVSITTRSWRSFLTWPVRMPYPNATTNGIIAGSGYVNIPVALSSPVCAPDTDLSVTFPADGWYAQGGTNSAAGTISITNNSAASYTNLLGAFRWAVPTRQRIYGTGGSWTNYLFYENQTWNECSPYGAVVMFGKDENNNVVSPVWAYNKVLNDSGYDILYTNDVFRFVLLTNGLSNLARVTNNAICFPARGDTNGVIDTSANVNGTVDTTPLYAPQIWFSTFGASYGELVAVVDATNGVAGGSITNLSLFTPGVTAMVPFLTVDAALVALKASNNTYFSHNDVGGVHVKMTNGTYEAVTGGSGSYATLPSTWTIIEGYDGLPQDSVIMTNRTTHNQKASGMDCIRNLRFDISSGVSTITGETYTWFDNNHVNISGGTAYIFDSTMMYGTRCSVTISGGSQGWSQSGSRNSAMAISMGNTINMVTGAGNGVTAYLFAGNKMPVWSKATWQPAISGSAAPLFNGSICANNAWWGFPIAAAAIQLPNNAPLAHMAIIQNLCEGITNSVQASIVGLGNDGGSASTPVLFDIVEVYDTVVGHRGNHAYNSEVGYNPLRQFWFRAGCFYSSSPIKYDTYNTHPLTANTNNWMVAAGVGHQYNVIANDYNTGNFSADFSNEAQPMGFELRQAAESNVNLPSTVSSPSAFPFVDNQEYNNVSATSGNGNYNWLSTTWTARVNAGNGFGLQPWIYKPHDLNGNVRAWNDPPGAFVQGNQNAVLPFM